MNTPEYTPNEMVRLEILAYKNPEGLHPVEENWRNLCRKLLEHTQAMQTKLESVKPKLRYDTDLENWTPTKFPKAFSVV